MIRFRRLSVSAYRIAPRIGVTKDNLVIVMHHPSTQDQINYSDTSPLPQNKPETAEELGRKHLLRANMADVDIEAHYHSRSYPTPEGYDVHTLHDMYPERTGKTHIRNIYAVPTRLAKIYHNTPRQWSIHNWAFECRQRANRPGIRRRERDPTK